MPAGAGLGLETNFPAAGETLKGEESIGIVHDRDVAGKPPLGLYGDEVPEEGTCARGKMTWRSPLEGEKESWKMEGREEKTGLIRDLKLLKTVPLT